MISKVEIEDNYPVMPIQKHGRDDDGNAEEKAPLKFKPTAIGDATMEDANPPNLAATVGVPEVVVTTEAQDKIKKSHRKREELLPPIAMGTTPYSVVADIGSKMVTMTMAQLCAVAPACQRELTNALSVWEKKHVSRQRRNRLPRQA